MWKYVLSMTFCRAYGHIIVAVIWIRHRDYLCRSPFVIESYISFPWQFVWKRHLYTRQASTYSVLVNITGDRAKISVRRSFCKLTAFDRFGNNARDAIGMSWKMCTLCQMPLLRCRRSLHVRVRQPRMSNITLNTLIEISLQCVFATTSFANAH